MVVSTGAEKPVDDHRIGMPDNKRHRKAKSAVAERSSNALHDQGEKYVGTPGSPAKPGMLMVGPK